MTDEIKVGEIHCLHTGERSACGCSVIPVRDEIFQVLDAEQRQPHDIAHVMIAVRLKSPDHNQYYVSVKLLPADALRLAARLMDAGLDLIQTPCRAERKQPASGESLNPPAPKTTPGIPPPGAKQKVRWARHTAKLISDRWRRLPLPPTIKEIAELLGVSFSLVSHWRNGLLVPVRPNHVKRFANLLAIPHGRLKGTIEKDLRERRTELERRPGASDGPGLFRHIRNPPDGFVTPDDASCVTLIGPGDVRCE